MSTATEPQPPNDDWWSSFTPGETTATEKRQYIAWSTRLYKFYLENENYTASDVMELFILNFEGWTADNFASAGSTAIYNLRQKLRDVGVYVKKEMRYSVAKSLYEVISGETSDQWPEDDSERPSTPPTRRTTAQLRSATPVTPPVLPTSTPARDPTPLLAPAPPPPPDELL